MKKISPSVIFTLVIALFSLGFLYFGRHFPARSKLIPFLVATFVLFLSMIQILFEAIPKFKKEEIGRVDLFHIEKVKLKRENILEEKKGLSNDENRGKELLDILLWILLLILGIYLIGFLIAVPIFLFLFYLTRCGYKWTNALGITFIFWIINYAIFELFLRLELYRGIIPMSFG